MIYTACLACFSSNILSITRKSLTKSGSISDCFFSLRQDCWRFSQDFVNGLRVIDKILDLKHAKQAVHINDISSWLTFYANLINIYFNYTNILYLFYCSIISLSRHHKSELLERFTKEYDYHSVFKSFIFLWRTSVFPPRLANLKWNPGENPGLGSIPLKSIMIFNKSKWLLSCLLGVF